MPISITRHCMCATTCNVLDDDNGVWFTVKLLISKYEVLVPSVKVAVLTYDVLTIFPKPGFAFASVTALAAIISVSTIPSGKPPTEIPVTVPDPLIEIGII